MRVRVQGGSIAVAFFMLLFLCLPTVAHADIIDVFAKVSAPLPPDTPVLLSPDNNSVVTTQSNTVLITGKCPQVVPPLIAVLIRVNYTIGSGSCDAAGIFKVTITLVLGVNVIHSKFMNVTGDSTIIGDLITLTYAPTLPTPVVVQPPEQQTPVAVTSAGALTLTFDQDAVIIKTKETTTIQFTISGGAGPYTVRILWGDGTSQTISYDTPGDKSLGHIYTSVQDHPVHITLSLKDASGATDRQERAVASVERPTVAAAPLSRRSYKFKMILVWAGLVIMSLIAVFVVHAFIYNRLTRKKRPPVKKKVTKKRQKR